MPNRNKKKRLHCEQPEIEKASSYPLERQRGQALKRPEGQVKKQSQAHQHVHFRIILAAVSLILYSNALRCGFVYDDHRAIIGNPDVTDSSPSSWLRLFRNDFWGTNISHRGSHKSYRPLVTLSFKLQYQLRRLLWSSGVLGTQRAGNSDHSETSGPFEALDFHLLNVILHVIVVDLVYQLASTLLATGSRARGENCNRRNLITASGSGESTFVAELSALMFACHPIHVEAVTSLVGRAELMGSLFALLSFKFLASYLSDTSAQSCDNHQQRLAKSLVAAALACLSKENCATVILINLFLVVWSHLRRRRRRRQQQQPSKYHISAEESKSFASMSALLITYAALRMRLNWSDDSQSIVPKFASSDNPLAQSAQSFCLRNRQEFGDRVSQSDLLDFCSDPNRIAQVDRWLRMTRAYLPTFCLQLLANPTSASSYDWPLSSVGLVKSPLETRFVLALVIYAAVAKFALSWLVGDLMRESDLIKSLSGVVRRAQEALAAKPPIESDLDASDSETSSLKSVDTMRSSDSGFIDSRGDADRRRTKCQPSTRASPAPSSSSGCESREMLGDDESGDLLPLTRADRLGWPLLWMLVPYLPASNLLFPVGFLVAERTLYLPSVGFCLLAAEALSQLPLGWCAIRALARTKSVVVCQLADRNGFRRPRSGAAITWPPIGDGGGFKVGGQMKNRTKLRRRVNQNNEDGTYDATIKSALILPLLISGALRLASRNADWRSDYSLYNSNLAQSPAKSLANLATLNSVPSPGGGGNPIGCDADESIRLYERALELDPTSAETHYNLALALHRKRDADSRPGGGGAEFESDPIEYHYWRAIELRRRNFPLAALSLGAHYYANRRQLDRAEGAFELCAEAMKSSEAKVFGSHVAARIECLISAAKMRSQTAAGCPAKVGRWLALARSLAAELPAEQTLEGEAREFEPRKQLATISWIEGRCARPRDAHLSARLLSEAADLAARSQVAVASADLYLDYAGSLASGAERLAAVEWALAVEGAKRGARAQVLARLHFAAAKLDSGGGAHLEEALRLEPRNADFTALAARLAHEDGRAADSERLYGRALELLAAERAPAARLASAHVNLGAILQVNGKWAAARGHYRQALAADAANRIARLNLERLERRLGRAQTL